MHPRERKEKKNGANEKLEFVGNAFDGEQRGVSSDDQNTTHDTFPFFFCCSLAFGRTGQ